MGVITDKCCVSRTFPVSFAYTERRQETGVKFLLKCAREGKFYFDCNCVSKYRATALFFYTNSQRNSSDIN